MVLQEPLQSTATDIYNEICELHFQINRLMKMKKQGIHIHSQQNDERRDGVKVYYYNPTTKNEKGVRNNGRYIPLTNRISHILAELKAKKKTLNPRKKGLEKVFNPGNPVK